MEDNKFNNYALLDDEVLKIIDDFKDEIRLSSIVFGKFNEDCEQEIKTRIYKSLTRNRKDKNNDKK